MSSAGGGTDGGLARYIGENYGTYLPSVRGLAQMWQDRPAGPSLEVVEVWVSQYKPFGAGKFKNWEEYSAWLSKSRDQ